MPTFTIDYLSVNLDTWNKVFSEEWRSKPIHALEIGSYEGLSACWMLDNVLRHPESRLVFIDNFVGIGAHNPNDPQGLSVRERCIRNLNEYGERVKLIEGDSKAVLKQMDPRELFDVIYIDGDHSAQATLTDSVFAFQHLKHGGLMIFDDYLWMDREPRRWWGPKEGIDDMLEERRVPSRRHDTSV